MVWTASNRASGTARTTRLDVEMDVTLECRDDSGAVTHLDTVFGFSVRDPYAVTITFRTPDGDLPWSFHRDLLIRGLHGPAGLGDVQIHPVRTFMGSDKVVIRLSSPAGRLVAAAKARDIRSFLRRADEVVPAGAEGDFLDLNQLIGQLLRATV